jgi:predicted alpha/beta hydrolase family esterase
MRFVIVPGLDGSDDRHWQSRWETDWLPSPVRIQPSSWTTPDLDDWSRAITTAVPAEGDVVFIAHSLGCLAVAHWLTTGSPLVTAVRGAFLVAPPDQLASTFPTTRLPTFASLPASPLGLPGVLVASDNDPYCTVEAATRLATCWEVPLVATGRHGHLNSESDLDVWPSGQRLLTSFLAGLGVSRFPVEVGT